MSSRGEKLVALAMAQAIEMSEEEFEEDSVKDKDYVPSSDEDDLEIVDTDDFEELENDENIANNQQTQATDNEDDWGKVQQSDQNLFDKKCKKDDVFTSLVSTTTPFDFFKLFVTDDLVDLMVEETNRYADDLKSSNRIEKARIKLWQPVAKNEIYKFFAVVLAMGIVDLPKTNLYWSKDNEFISKCLSRDRFLLILRCWHFTDNSLNTGMDKLFKLRKLIDPIIQKFQEFITPGESVVIDESMIPWRGRLQFRQYMKNKSHKYGVKDYKLCTVGGYIFNFKIYCGRGDPKVKVMLML
ncbi:hypothetical protein JTB14_037378 [Gonioctena quinquepunctata]|nr:hypothetical protein JTB14_037378 [Gonioctena quinquepunctata]